MQQWNEIKHEAGIKTNKKEVFEQPADDQHCSYISRLYRDEAMVWHSMASSVTH